MQVFPTADTGFILSYSVIMLNTDAHNPNIKPERRMTKDGFISNNRGIAAGQDLPRELLCNIYDSIVSRPITLKEDDKLRERVQVCVEVAVRACGKTRLRVASSSEAVAMGSSSSWILTCMALL